MFVLKTSEKHILPKSVLQDIFNSVRFLVSYIHEAYTQVPPNEGNHREGVNLPDNDISPGAAFDSVSSDFLLNKYCKSHLGLIEPQEFILGETVVNGKTVQHSMQYIPILQVLDQYLGHSDLWSNMNRNRDADNELLVNYESGVHFQKSEFFSSHPDALRLMLYTDEFEIVNPLGAKRGQQKLVAFYFVVDNVEARCRSSLKNIHLALLVKNKLIQTYGYDTILKPLLKDLKKLETEGVTISVDGIQYHRHGTVVAICGDNLSSHAIGRFSTCFSSGRICRFCMANKN